MKICPKCGISKATNEFHKNKSKKDGLSGWCKLCNKSNYESNLDANRLKRREWHVKNRDLVLPKMRENYQKNKPQRQARIAEWKRNNKPKVNETYRLRELRKKDASIGQISKKEIQKLYAANCFYCGSSDNIQIDHIIPLAKGGSHSIGNLTSACKTCNSSKNDTFLFEWLIKRKANNGNH